MKLKLIFVTYDNNIPLIHKGKVYEVVVILVILYVEWCIGKSRTRMPKRLE